MLALASLLILSSCGQTAGVKTAGAQQTTGEIVASSETAIAQTCLLYTSDAADD